MIKNYLSPFLFTLCLFSSFIGRSQQSTSATYTAGILSTDASTVYQVTTNSSCPGILTVNVPAGRFISSVDVSYDMEALGINWISGQWSYLECVSTSLRESQITNGLANTGGVQNYTRTGLSIANGLVGAGGVQFKLHAFRSLSGSCSSGAQRVNNNSWTVTVHHMAAPSCLPPTGIQASGTTVNSINLSWITGGASNWQVEYGPVGFTLGSGIQFSTTSNPHTLSGLLNSSQYEVYIQDSCGIGDVSSWAGPYTFSTLCAPVSAPYLEDFEVSSFAPAIFFNDTGSIDHCWDRTTGAYFWTPGPPQFTTLGTGPLGDHTSGSGQYMYADYGTPSTFPPYQTLLETPFIDLSSLANPELIFWYHMYGNGIGSLTVEIDNGSGYVNLISYTGEQQNGNSHPWKESNSILSSYANDTVRIRFVASIPVGNIRTQISIDDISLDEAPTCPKPQNVQSANVSSNSLDLSWTSGGATNWQIEYGPSGFSPGTGTLLNVASNPYTVNGLSPNITYDFYLRDSCSATDVSPWFGPFSENTNCTLFSAPYTENFDASVWIPSNGSDPGGISPCWSRNNTNLYYFTTGQNATPSFNTGPNADHTSGVGKYIYTEGFSSGNPNITSPSIDISTLTNPELRFWYHMFGASISEIKVLIHDGSSWSVESTIPGPVQASNTAAWQEHILDLSSYVGDTIRIRFRGIRNGVGSTSDIAIDDVWVGNTPTCPNSINFSASAPNQNAINVGWTPGAAAHRVVRYRIKGSSAPFTHVQVTTFSSTQITGLNPATTYEIFLQDSCGIGDVSLWQGPIFETTECSVFTAPWAENFDGPEWIPGNGFGNIGNQISPCWFRFQVIREWGTISGPTQTPNTGPNSAFSGPNYLYREGSGAFSGLATIQTPSIAIPASMNSPHLYFYYHMYGANVTVLDIRVDAGNGDVIIYTKTGQQQTSSAAAWIKDSVDLSAYSGDTIVLKILGGNNGFSGDLAIDDLSIRSSGPLCSDPSALVVSNINTHDVDLSWISTNVGSSTVQYYDIAAGLPGTLIPNQTSPITLSGLNPNTTYVINVYDSCTAAVQSGLISDTISTMACPLVTAGFNFTSNLLSSTFSSTSLNADSLAWDFDGNGISDSVNPVFNFTNPGIYNVRLIAYNFCGTSDTITIPIQVCDSLLPSFIFSNINDTIQFDASGTLGAQSYEWDFGNGNFGVGSQINEYYASSGKFPVHLKVKNSCGDSAIFTDTVQICLSPLAKWSFTIISSGAAGMEVQFDGSTSLNATSYSWDFGDGNTNTNSSQPIHTYVVPSVLYQVTLTVTNACNETHSSSNMLNEIGITEFFKEDKVDIYPNPTSNRTFVEWNPNNLQPQEIQVLDVSGRMLRKELVDRGSQNQGRMELELRDLANGVYIIRLKGVDLDIKEEFMVQH